MFQGCVHLASTSSLLAKLSKVRSITAKALRIRAVSQHRGVLRGRGNRNKVCVFDRMRLLGGRRWPKGRITFFQGSSTKRSDRAEVGVKRGLTGSFPNSISPNEVNNLCLCKEGCGCNRNCRVRTREGRLGVLFFETFIQRLPGDAQGQGGDALVPFRSFHGFGNEQVPGLLEGRQLVTECQA